VDGEGGYSWGGANGTQFWVDRTHQLFVIFMVQTHGYRAPTYNTFRSLVNESARITGRAGSIPAGNAMSGLLKQRDTNRDGKLGADEIPAALMQRLDADKDGFVTADELKALRTP
jgi:hypothetical protein